jgi:hypothetical protein
VSQGSEGLAAGLEATSDQSALRFFKRACHTSALVGNGSKIPVPSAQFVAFRARRSQLV